MPAVNAPAKVMVTGASGFVAAWVIKNLLDEGYVVRGTLRSIGKAKHYNNIFKKEVEEARLEFVEVPDMSVKGAFDAAVRDMDAILHIASPVTVHVDDPDGESILQNVLQRITYASPRAYKTGREWYSQHPRVCSSSWVSKSAAL